MKKIFQNRLFIFILGGIVFSSITAIAINISADQIEYSTGVTVKDKIDDLYKKTKISFWVQGRATAANTPYASTIWLSNFIHFTYFEIKDFESSNNKNNSCTLTLWNSSGDTPVVMNQRYNVSDYDTLYSYSVANTQDAYCQFYVSFYD